MFARKILQYFTTPDEPRLFRWLLPVLFALSLPLFFLAARAHSETFNHDRFSNDQNIFLNIAKQQRESDGQAMTARQRTPGYGYILAPFWNESLIDPSDPDGIGEAWFARAKMVNISLSLVLLLVLLAGAAGVTGIVEAVFLAFATAFLLYVFRAGYSQPEPTYWVLKVLCYYLLGRMLVRPGWILAAASGLLAAAAFLVKAGIQPLLVLFLFCFLVKLVWDRFYHRRDVTLGHLARGLLVPLVYLAVLSPYFYNSYRKFGDPLFNSHVKYMMWIPDGDKHQVHALQNIGSDSRPFTLEEFQSEYVRLALKDDPGGTLRPEDVRAPGIPTFGHYWQEHGLSEILWRPAKGVGANHKRMVKYYPGAYDLLGLLSWVALGVAVLAWRRVLPDLRDYLPVLLYVLGFFAGYLILYGWYDGLRLGVRLMLSLYLPALATLVLFVGHYSSDLRLRVRGRPVYLRKVLNVALAVVLASKIHSVLTDELYRNYSGA